MSNEAEDLSRKAADMARRAADILAAHVREQRTTAAELTAHAGAGGKPKKAKGEKKKSKKGKKK